MWLRQLPLDAQIMLELEFWERLTIDEFAAVVEVLAEAMIERRKEAQRAVCELLDRQRNLTERIVDTRMTEGERRPR